MYMKSCNRRLIYRRELQLIIDDYKNLNGDNGFWSNFDPDSCTWHQVQDELNKVEEEYRQKGKGSFLRRALRRQGLTRTLIPLLEGIPENDGLGFLKGGLIILFNARHLSLRYDPTLYSLTKHSTPRPLRAGRWPARKFSTAFVRYQIFSKLHTKP